MDNVQKMKSASDANGFSDVFDWLVTNAPLLLLLKNEEVPTLEQVIDCKERMWSEGLEPDARLLKNLIELSVFHEKHRKRESRA